MSKSDRPLAEIDIGPARKDLRTPRWLGDADITAFDFETADGRPFQLAVAEPEHRRGSYVVEPASRSGYLDADTIISVLSSQRFAGNQICVWYNLGFDAEIFARSLGEAKATELYLENHTTFERSAGGTVEITYIPGKMLTFTLPNGKGTIEHFDIGNIVRGGLAGAAAEWLGEDKLTETVDATAFGDESYRTENWHTIREYAERDAELTRDLAREVLSKAEAVDIPCRRPVSTGSLAVSWFGNMADCKPMWGPSAAQRLAWDSYAGGRFEVFERGMVGKVTGPDINSAYPAVMAELPDPGSLSWRIDSNVSLDALRDADYGFVDVTVSTDADRRIQPFAKKIDDVVTYPAFDGGTTTTLLDIFLFALDAGIITDWSINNAALGYVTDSTTYPFEFLEEVYAERKRLESNSRPRAGLMLKIVLNSMYGKTAQTTLKREILREETYAESAAAKPNERLRSHDGIPYVESQVAGSLFNPFIASYITGRTRLELHRSVVESGLESDTKMLATDCIMVDADAYADSDFDSRMGDSLGEWDFDYEGTAFVVGSGVYEVATAEGLKMGTRGFREAKFSSLAREASTADGPIEIEQTRPTTLGEAVARGESTGLEDIGKFRASKRGLSADFDSKRDWPNRPEWSDLLDGSQYGRPIVISD